ncbi:MFS transporter [Vallicoccus soli]|uniref:MFS transporter n=1 Tax=Vallicoccus soli TaxID=2339232 RepID=A0A3A3ZDN5_9ACTN|nr:MFS transporter [Vallicoccus soli]RJK93156.1 MFS transporter [Vallicoccus soli]
MRTLDEDGTRRRVHLAEPLGLRDFRLLWAGMSVSLLGDGLFLVALAWQVYDLSGSPAAMSLVGVAMSVPQVVLLLAGGVLSDRADRRLLMVASDLLRAAVLAAVGALAVTGALEVPHLYVAAALYGGAAAFFGPAFDATVPSLVPERLLVQANALDQLVRPFALGIAGPALGGVVIGSLGTGTAFLLDAASFLVCALCIARLRTRPPVEAGEGSAWEALRGGLSYVRSHVWLWATFVAATFSYLLFLGPTEVLLPYLVKEEMGLSAHALGLVLASGGLGALLAAAVVGQCGLPRRFVTLTYVAWALATLAVAGYGLATSTWQLAVACALVNGLEAVGTVAWAVTKQRFVPPHLLGRVSSLDWFVSLALVPLSYALAAPAAALLGARTTLVVAGVLGAAVTAAFLLLPGMRAPERGAVAPAGEPAPVPVAA